MSRAIKIKGEPVTYDTEANAGVDLATGERWWGTLIRWRRGTSGKWLRFTIVDVHPMDTRGIERALRAYVTGSYTRRDGSRGKAV